MTTAVGSAVTIVPVSFTAVLDAPNSKALIRAYAEECSVPGAEPQRDIYAAMERAGVLHCFAALADGILIGFCAILTARMPHTGNLLATGESIFVDPAYRDTGAGDCLIEAAEQHAQNLGATLAWVPRAGSAFDKILSRRAGYMLTHHQYTRRLT